MLKDRLLVLHFLSSWMRVRVGKKANVSREALQVVVDGCVARYPCCGGVSWASPESAFPPPP